MGAGGGEEGCFVWGRMVGKNLQLKRVKKFGSFRDYRELANVRAYNVDCRVRLLFKGLVTRCFFSLGDLSVVSQFVAQCRCSSIW